MDLREMTARALEVRAQFGELERRRYDRTWTAEEIMLGFVGDVGDLAKLVQGKAGVRARDVTSPTVAGWTSRGSTSPRSTAPPGWRWPCSRPAPSPSGSG